MSEHVGGLDLFSSGGHRWTWGERLRIRKTFGAVGVDGAASMLLAGGPCPGRVAGILKASGASRAVADAALDALEVAILEVADEGLAWAWEDDSGHAGEALVVLEYRRAGPRTYPRSAGAVAAWQAYEVRIVELDGTPVATT